MSAKTSTSIPPVTGSPRSSVGEPADGPTRPWSSRAAELARTRREAPSIAELAEDVVALRGMVQGLLAERAVLESRLASLERAMSEPWPPPAPAPELQVANEQRLFVRLRRLIPLSLRKVIVETYRGWSR